MEKILTLLRSLAEERIVSSGERLYEDGATPGGAYFLISGRVRLLVHASCGKTLITRVVRPGDFFGVGPLFSGKPYEGSAEPLELSRVGFIPKRALFELIQREPEARLPILSILSEDLNGCQAFIRLAGTAA